MQKRILKTLKDSAIEWIEFFVSGWPETYVGKKIRRFYWKKKYNLATHPYIGRITKLSGDKENIFIGKNFICGESVEINACLSHGIYIGNNVSIARGTYIRSSNHRFDRLDVPIAQQGHVAAEMLYQDKNYSVIIEDDVWIGANAIILSAAKIGKGAVIAAGSVVSAEIPPYSIVVGNPGRVARTRVNENTQGSEHEKI